MNIVAKRLVVAVASLGVALTALGALGTAANASDSRASAAVFPSGPGAIGPEI